MEKGLSIFKIEQKFKNINELYKYLLKNADFIEKYCEIKIKRPLKKGLFYITGVEAVDGRKILFYATKELLPESIGELIVLAGACNSKIIIFLTPKINATLLEPMNWLQSICNTDIKFVLIEVSF